MVSLEVSWAQCTPGGYHWSMTTTTFHVQGMTCGHCVAAVREEIGRLAGVSDVEVDLATGRVDVTSETPVPRSSVADAVDEAGYSLTD